MMTTSHYTETHKRTPCPVCGSKTQFHDGHKNGVFFPLHCHKCGYNPTTNGKVLVVGSGVLCDCGKPLKSANERKSNTCHKCLSELNLNFQADDYSESGDTATLCDCGKPLKTDYQIKIKKCFYCQTLGALSAKADNSAKTFGNFGYKKGLLSGLVMSESGACITSLWNKSLMAIRASDGLATGYQLIDEKGNKKFAFPLVKNTADNAFFHCFIGNRETAKHKVKCEGYATGISIAMAKPDTCILVCFTADNLIKAAKVFGAEFSITATDKDLSFTGINKATEAAKIDGSKIWLSPVSSDFNDLHKSQGLQAVSDSFERDIYEAGSLHLLAVKHGVNFVQTDNPLGEVEVHEGITILSAAMGSGKSRLYFPKVKVLGDSCLAIAHLKSLVDALCKVLILVSYLNSDIASDFLGLCINSIEKYVRQYDVVLIDEFHAVLDWLGFGSTAKDNERIRAYNALKQILGTAKYSVFASATMRPEHVESVIMLSKELGQKVTIIEHTVKPSKKLIVENYGDFTDLRADSIKRNRNIFGFSLSKDDVIAYNDKLQSEGISTVAIHSGEKGQNMHLITSGDYDQFQAVLGSPAMLAGCHIVGHIDDVYCDLSSKTEISPLSAIQALGRVRTTETVYVTLQGGKDKLSESAFVTSETILRNKRASQIASLRDTYEAMGYSNDEIDSMCEAHSNRPFTDYDRFNATLQKAHNDEFTNYNANFLGYTKQLGYEIVDNRHIKTAEDKEARRERSEGIQTVKTQRYADISNVYEIAKERDIILPDIKILRDKTDKTELEQYAVIYHDCKDIFESATAETIENVIENNLHSLAKDYALLRCESVAIQCLLEDEKSIESGEKSTANFRNSVAKREILLALMAVAGVTIDYSDSRPETVPTGNYNFSGAVELTAETDLSEVLELIKKHRFTIEFKRYATLSHKSVIRFLRDLLGYELITKRISGGGRVWRVAGLANDLIAVGGGNRLKCYFGETSKDYDKAITFCVSTDSLKKTKTQKVMAVCQYDE